MFKKNYHSINMQKVLFIAQEFHQRGYEKLRVLPYASPSGMYWRCDFYISKEEKYFVSGWILQKFDIEKQEIPLTIPQLADLLLKEEDFLPFLQKSFQKDEVYTTWYAQFLTSLNKNELPIALADYDLPEKNQWYLNNKRKYQCPFYKDYQ